jgi:hypothetical protein
MRLLARKRAAAQEKRTEGRRLQEKEEEGTKWISRPHSATTAAVAVNAPFASSSIGQVSSSSANAPIRLPCLLPPIIGGRQAFRDATTERRGQRRVPWKKMLPLLTAFAPLRFIPPPPPFPSVFPFPSQGHPRAGAILLPIFFLFLLPRGPCQMKGGRRRRRDGG